MSTSSLKEPAPLTPEQVKHWRDALFALVGPYAYLAPAEEIERYRAQMQRNLNGKPTQ